MKKIISVILFAVLLTIALVACDPAGQGSFDTTAPVSSEKVDETETPAQDFEYTVSENRDKITIVKYLGNDDRVVIPEKIEGIPVAWIGLTADLSEQGKTEGAFEESHIKSVVIPDSVVTVGYRAFQNCSDLSEVTLGAQPSLKVIADNAFHGCASLTSLDLRAAAELQTIGKDTFSDCTKLKNIQFSDNVRSIDERAFQNCTSLESVELPKKLETLGKDAFSFCTSLKSITVPTKVDLNMFDGSAICQNPALEQVIFENGREELAGYAFFSTVANSDVEIIIPASVKKIDTYSFLINGSAEIVFSGDCPETTEHTEFNYGDATNSNIRLYYDPSTAGWDSCAWKDIYSLEPISEK